MSRLVLTFVVAAFALLVGAPARAEAPFSPHARDNNPDDLNRALTLIRGSKAAASRRPMGFYVSNHPEKRLLGVYLGGRRVAWNEPSRPVIPWTTRRVSRSTTMAITPSPP